MKKTVTVEGGRIEGCFGYDPRITVFKGVPYAAPPVGALRWRAPQPVVPWEGVRCCDRYAPIAWQHTPGADPKDFWSRELHPSAPEFPMGEDCLYLNVFTPAETPAERLPVLYYIHGGGYSGGYPFEVEFDWEHMARKGMVVVSVTYRLGVFGFLAHPTLTAEAGDGPKSNFGILDQLAGLQWVRRNIAAFGGDPEKITVAGQSAGAGSVQCLITSPLAEGLITGAIIQSAVSADFADLGPSFLRTGSLARAEQTGVRFFEKAGISTLEEARALPASAVFERAAEMGPGMHFTPNVDGVLLPEAAFDAYCHDAHHRIPILTGYNRGETRAFMRRDGLPRTMAEYDVFAARYGAQEARFRALCPVTTDAEVEALFQNEAFVGMIAGARLFGTLQSRQERTTYLYEFDPDIPGEDHAGSFHGSELWFAYDSLARSWRPFVGWHYNLARQVSGYWANFVKTGDPNGADGLGFPLPVWPAYTEQSPVVMKLRNTPSAETDPADPVLQLRIGCTLAGS